MKKNISGSSIIEAMIVLLVVVTGIIWVFNIMMSSQRLSTSTSDRITAIQIARDGLESFTNIRDTNWIYFAADYENCWNALNYDKDCIWNNTNDHDIKLLAWRWFTIAKNSNNQFELTNYPTGLYSDSIYRWDYRVQKDSQGFFTQNGGTDFTPIYTREIQIDYLDINNVSQGSSNSNHPKIKVTTIIQWNDVATKSPKKLEMSTVLTNWKTKK